MMGQKRQLAATTHAASAHMSITARRIRKHSISNSATLHLKNENINSICTVYTGVHTCSASTYMQYSNSIFGNISSSIRIFCNSASQQQQQPWCITLQQHTQHLYFCTVLWYTVQCTATATTVVHYTSTTHATSVFMYCTLYMSIKRIE